MKGIIKKIEKKDYKTSQGKSFSKIVITCDVEVNDIGDIKTLKATYSPDFAKKYFEYCKISSKQAINKDVNVVVAKKNYEDNNGNSKTYSYIKFLNFLDEDGEPIIMLSDKKEEDIGF